MKTYKPEPKLKSSAYFKNIKCRFCDYVANSVQGIRCHERYNNDKNPEPVFVDAQGTPLADKNILKDVRGGTVVEIIIEHKPSMPVGKIGSKLIVKGVQILKLVTSSGASDSGDLSSEEIAASFKKQEGFCQDDPNVQMDQKEATDEYNF